MSRIGKKPVAVPSGVNITLGGQAVTVGSIIVTQCGTKFSPGRFVRMSKNCSIFSLVDGKVYFDQGGKRINVEPADATATAIG